VARAVRPGDAILVKGSLGSRMRLVVQALDALGGAREPRSVEVPRSVGALGSGI